MSWRYLLPGGAGMPQQFTLGLTTATSYTLDSSGDRAAYYVLITKAGNIHKVTIRVLGVTALTATARVSLQGLDSSGNPDANLTYTATLPAPSANTFYQVTLGTDMTVVVGQIVAVVVDFSAYTSGSFSISMGNESQESPFGTLAPALTNFYDGASWTKLAGRAPYTVLEYDDATVAYQPNCVPFAINSALTYNNTSNPKEYGNFIKFNETTRVIGAEFPIDADNAYSVILYDTNGTTELATAVGSAVARSGTSVNRTGVLFSSPATCVGGSTYRLVIRPTSASSISVYQSASDANAARDLNMLAGGADWHLVQLSSSNVWSANTRRRVAIWPVIDAIDIRQSMTGGMQT